jgi:F0F1-type ATP synthase membrane subunit b/b'
VKAQHAIELEHRKMLAEARTEIARLVVVTAERVLAKKLSDADRAAYNEAAAANSPSSDFFLRDGRPPQNRSNSPVSSSS